MSDAMRARWGAESSVWVLDGYSEGVRDRTLSMLSGSRSDISVVTFSPNTPSVFTLLTEIIKNIENILVYCRIISCTQSTIPQSPFLCAYAGKITVLAQSDHCPPSGSTCACRDRCLTVGRSFAIYLGLLRLRSFIVLRNLVFTSGLTLL